MGPLGIVLTGGGSRGAFQAGVLAALGDRISVRAIAGCSIGAINAALFTSHHADAKTLLRAWSGELPVLYPSPLRILWSLLLGRRGLFDSEILRNIVRSLIDVAALAQSPMDCFVCCHSLSRGSFSARLNGESPDKVVDYIAASMAVPFLFNPILIDGDQVVDGSLSFSDLIGPVIYSGCHEIVVIYTSPAKMPPTLPQSFWQFVDQTVEGMVRENMEADIALALAREPGRIPVLVWRVYPQQPLGTTLDFSTAAMAFRLEHGLEVGKSFLEGTLLTDRKGHTRRATPGFTFPNVNP